MLRILIADDHHATRRGVRSLIEDHPGWEVCGEASDGQSALALALKERPDVVVLDIQLPTLNGLMVTRRLRDQVPSASVLLFTMSDDDDTIHRGLEAGARGFVLKSEGSAFLELGISALSARRTYFGPAVADLLIETANNDRRGPRAGAFTRRELEVAELIADGKSNKEIARLLQRSVKTIESHRTAAMRKAGVRNAGELVRFAIKHHLINA